MDTTNATAMRMFAIAGTLVRALMQKAMDNADTVISIIVSMYIKNLAASS